MFVGYDAYSSSEDIVIVAIAANDDHCVDFILVLYFHCSYYQYSLYSSYIHVYVIISPFLYSYHYRYRIVIVFATITIIIITTATIIIMLITTTVLLPSVI